MVHCCEFVAFLSTLLFAPIYYYKPMHVELELLVWKLLYVWNVAQKYKIVSIPSLELAGKGSSSIEDGFIPKL
jgi:hypothetical protein